MSSVCDSNSVMFDIVRCGCSKSISDLIYTFGKMLAARGHAQWRLRCRILSHIFVIESAFSLSVVFLCFFFNFLSHQNVDLINVFTRSAVGAISHSSSLD